MTHTGAANAIVKITTRPLLKLNSPYLTLSFTYLVGQILNLFIPSAAGLAMLLLVALYPTLLQIGVTPSSAAAVIGTTACLDLGPLSGTTIVAASTSDLPVTTYFFFHQFPVAIFAALSIAILHYPVQKYFDSREEKPLINKHNMPTRAGADTHKVPAVYALLPVLPLLLLVIFSDLIFSGIKLHVVTAVLISLFTVLLAEGARTKNVKSAIIGLQSFLFGMWSMFRTVVTLILAAEVFASGLWSTGILHSMIQSVQLLGHAPFAIMLVLIKQQCFCKFEISFRS